MTDHIRNGIGSVRPYLDGPLSLLEFIVRVFDAKELERHQLGPQSSHGTNYKPFKIKCFLTTI